MDSLTMMPLWLSGLVLVVIPALLVMVGLIQFRRFVSLETLSANNEVAGFKFAVIGVLYAVLLAFAVVVVWERFSATETEVAHEAGAAATLYRLADGIQGEGGLALRQQLSVYLKDAVATDWPAMEHDRASPSTTAALNVLYGEALKLSQSGGRDGAVLSEILHQLDLLTQARRARLVATTGAVPGILWLVLFSGALVTIGFTFFFGTESSRAQAAMTGALTFLIGSSLLVIVAIDDPFAGTVRVGPEPLVAVLEQLGNK